MPTTSATATYTFSVTVVAPAGSTYDDIDTEMLSFIDAHGCLLVNTSVTPDDDDNVFLVCFEARFKGPDLASAQAFSREVLAAGQAAYGHTLTPCLQVQCDLPL